MLGFISENLSSLVIGLVVFVILTLIVVKLIRDKIAGKSSCASCSGCCSTCHSCDKKH